MPDEQAFGGLRGEDDVVQVAAQGTVRDELGRGAECEVVLPRVAFETNTNGHIREWEQGRAEQMPRVLRLTARS